MPQVRDGFVSLMGGMSGRIQPELLSETAYARGVNISSRGGLVHTRPVFRMFPWQPQTLLAETFQGMGVFRLQGTDRLIFCSSGHLEGVNLNTGELTGYAQGLSAAQPLVHFCQADKYFIAQDGASVPIIINPNDDPTLCRQADQAAPDHEVPTGTIMAYGHGRLFVVVANVGGTSAGNRFFAAGDIIQQPNHPEYVLRFTEIDYLAGGGAFSLPSELGYITGMCFLRNAQSGTGIGNLVVFARRGVSSFVVSVQRSTWQNVDISQVLFMDAGTYSPFSIIPVNNDIVFRGRDGLRTIGYTATGAGSSNLYNDPVSTDVDEWFEGESVAQLQRSSCAWVNNRVFSTVMPVTEGGVQHYQGLVSMDASVVASMGQASPTIFDGIWTGFRFLRIASALYNGKETLFAVVRTAGSNLLYYLDEEAIEDDPSSVPQCRLYTRAFEGGDAGRGKDKRLSFVDLWFKELLGAILVKVYYRPAGYELWNLMGSTTIAAGAGLRQHRSRIRFGVGPEVWNDATKQSVLRGLAFQLCVEWTGEATLQRCHIGMESQDDSSRLACSSSESSGTDLVPGSGGVELDDFDYEVLP